MKRIVNELLDAQGFQQIANCCIPFWIVESKDEAPFDDWNVVSEVHFGDQSCD